MALNASLQPWLSEFWFGVGVLLQNPGASSLIAAISGFNSHSSPSICSRASHMSVFESAFSAAGKCSVSSTLRHAGFLRTV
eukprot:8720719-Karenia_brevis.AAC.1